MSTLRPSDETIRVLFIENDVAVAEMYRLKLELDGYQVAVVENDDQVMRKAATTQPDMIFLDLRPGEDQGFATLQQLRAAACTRDVPVIILSNQGAHEMAGRGFKADLLDYVVRADPALNLQDWARAGSSDASARP